jgi:hypothetical protein
LLVSWEENIEMVALDRTAAINHLDRLAIMITGDGELRSEGVNVGVSSDKDSAIVTDIFPAGGDAVGVGAAAFGAGAVGGDFHPDNVRDGRARDIIMQQLDRPYVDKRRRFSSGADEKKTNQRDGCAEKFDSTFIHVRPAVWPMKVFTRERAEFPTPLAVISQIIL